MEAKATPTLLRPCLLPVCDGDKFELVHKFPTGN